MSCNSRIGTLYAYLCAHVNEVAFELLRNGRSISKKEVAFLEVRGWAAQPWRVNSSTFCLPHVVFHVVLGGTTNTTKLFLGVFLNSSRTKTFFHSFKGLSVVLNL